MAKRREGAGGKEGQRDRKKKLLEKKDEGKQERRRSKVTGRFWDSFNGWVGRLVSRNWCQHGLSGVVATPTLHFVYSHRGEKGLLVLWRLETWGRYHLSLLSSGDKSTKTVKAIIVKKPSLVKSSSLIWFRRTVPSVFKTLAFFTSRVFFLKSYKTSCETASLRCVRFAYIWLNMLLHVILLYCVHVPPD